jgi:hypothetical protein
MPGFSELGCWHRVCCLLGGSVGQMGEIGDVGTVIPKPPTPPRNAEWGTLRGDFSPWQEVGFAVLFAVVQAARFYVDQCEGG